MNEISITGRVNEQHLLSARVPDSFPPGPVTIVVTAAPSDSDIEDDWMMSIAHEWADDLNDARQDIYSLADGEPVNAT